MRRALGLILLAASVSAAQDRGARYRIEGTGPEGACTGAALVSPDPVGPGLIVALKTIGPDGGERRLQTAAHREGHDLVFSGRASRGVLSDALLIAHARRVDRGPRASA